MSRVALSIAILAGLLASPAWALPQLSSCRASSRPRALVLWAPICALSQDPWQDCDEDPWQLSLPSQRADDRFSDPWQDGGDPWQPVFAAPVSMAAEVDPWQPLAIRLRPASARAKLRDVSEDPWQPTFADPWQDGVEDPWQLP
jgi:hypothetical protein